MEKIVRGRRRFGGPVGRLEIQESEAEPGGSNRVDEPRSQTHAGVTAMVSETRRDRRARFALETLEGRTLLSAGSRPWSKPDHLEHRPLFATAPPPSVINSIPTAGRHFDRPRLTALKGMPKPVQPAITAAVTAGPDAIGSVTISGRTYRRAKVSLDLQANGSSEQTARANAKGQFQFTFTVGFGSTPVRLFVTAHGHRPTSITLTVNRTEPPPIPSPGTPQPAPNLPVGVWDYYYSQIASRIVNTKLRLTINADTTGVLEFAILTEDRPFDPSSDQLVHWVFTGNFAAQGSDLVFDGQGTVSETNAEDPSMNRTYSANLHLDNPYFGEVNQGTILDLTLDEQFGEILSPGGPTRNIALNKIG
jgi:hypothetical protein